MSIFGKLKSDGLTESEDRLGGYKPLETDIYTGTVKMAYVGASSGGAQFVSLELELPGGKTHRETIYVTNKKGEHWFLNKDDKTKKVPLPGFTTIDDICLVAAQAPLADMVAEDKMVKVWDTDAKKEVPKSVPVLTGLLGKTVSVSIVKVLENKNEKNSAGEYVPTAETRETNVIDKVFDTESKMTVAEARNGSESQFWDAWLERNKGQTRDKRTIKDGATAGAAGRPGARPSSAGAGAPAAGAPSARKSLFGPKAA